MVFDPKKYLIKVQGGKQYLPVSARLIWFRETHPDWGIETKLLTLDIEKQYAVFEATVFNSEGRPIAKGTKMEDVRGFPDYVEKAETGAIGRALAVCGFGTQFAPELDEMSGERFVDSPQPRSYDRDRYQEPRNGGGYRPQSPEPRESRDPTPPRPSNAAPDTRPAESRSDAKPDETQRPATRPAATEVPGDASCSACGRELTHSQAVFSVGKFGVALCPTCQKERRSAEV